MSVANRERKAKEVERGGETSDKRVAESIYAICLPVNVMPP